jgi:Malate synthase
MNLFSKFFKSSNHSANEINLKISSSLEDFTKNEVLPGLNISPHYFWSSFENLVEKFSSRNKNLLIKRSELQEKIDHWHIQNRNKEFNLDEYKNFLTDIGYLHPRAGNFKIKTWNVDPEIRKIAGPQLVVPLMNARFALNAANARWGSLYDSLNGTNIITDEDGATREGGLTQ